MPNFVPAGPAKRRRQGEGWTRGAAEGKGGRCRAGCSPVNEGRCAAAGLGGWSGSSGGRWRLAVGGWGQRLA
jgi:hypothetical protein